MKFPFKSLVLTALILFLMIGVSEASAADVGSPGAPQVHNKTLLETIAEGGWVMFPIGIMSILTLYLSVDGFLRTSRQRTSPPDYESELKSYFQHGDYVGAYTFCRDNKSPLTNILRVGISLLGDGKNIVEEGILSEMSKENAAFGTQINYLSVIGVVTPMMGLLGTVTGIIRAFSTLGSSGIGDPSSLSGAIGEVLVATASGLVIAIPAFGMFYYLRNRSTAAMHHIQDVVNLLFRKMPYDLLQGVHISGEEIYAATPNWLGEAVTSVPEIVGDESHPEQAQTIAAGQP